MKKDNDDWLIELGEALEAEERIPAEIDEEKVKQVYSVKEALDKIVSGDRVFISSKVHSPSKSMGYVRVIGEQIIITNYEALAIVSKMASVVDIYPKTDGRVQMDFTFNGLTKRG